MRNTDVIMSDIIDFLLEKFGVLETEVFISTILSNRFDYTLWRQEHFGGMTPEELNEKAAAYARDNHTPAPNVKIV